MCNPPTILEVMATLLRLQPHYWPPEAVGIGPALAEQWINDWSWDYKKKYILKLFCTR